MTREEEEYYNEGYQQCYKDLKPLLEKCANDFEYMWHMYVGGGQLANDALSIRMRKGARKIRRIIEEMEK